MTKKPVPVRADDITQFTRALARQLGDNSPSHLTLMNMVARATGFGNVQHMRASAAAADRLGRAPEEDTLADPRTVERALHQFDAAGRLRQWPSKRQVQTLALWALWAVLPAEAEMEERAVNDALLQKHLFKDPATLRRTMISCGLLTRERDGSAYRRVEQPPPAEARALIRILTARWRQRAPDRV